MTEESFSREEMIEPIERLFERETGRDNGLFVVHKSADAQKSPTDGTVDLVFLAEDRTSLHSVRLVTEFDTCLFDMERGILSLDDVQANASWIALPLDEFRAGDESYNGIMEDTCAKRNIGIIVVQPKGRGISAKILLDAPLTSGDYLDNYPELKKKWREDTRGVLVGDDYRVVEYYNR
ncbi:hypothetical protein [Bradymonas sediminis]|uniref:Uncharacterized protein n=1 Tax=Bradymonas sediminis TaxID=1548548 RepID=A0A2Z4FNT1_9DELT|nr:hypothetical protein [Bradymonas sediminis]AWV90603.1 hypothetical protein DN745_15230 [Bradymonas sediminis]TDP62399.1 hypothetical protein DFR33_11362 [Bradymonas sediminis]